VTSWKSRSTATVTGELAETIYARRDESQRRAHGELDAYPDGNGQLAAGMAR